MSELMPGYDEDGVISPCGDEPATFDLASDQRVVCGLPAHHKGPHEDVWEGWRWDQ